MLNKMPIYFFSIDYYFYMYKLFSRNIIGMASCLKIVYASKEDGIPSIKEKKLFFI